MFFKGGQKERFAVNLKQIAELAGVSIGTVDRVLHNRGRVSQANVEKILRIAKESGYEPNPLASRLSSRRKIAFGVLIPELHSEFGYWQQVYRGFQGGEKELRKQQIELYYAFYDRSRPESFVEAADSLFEKEITAYIVAPLIPDMMRRVASDHPDIPFVFIDSTMPEAAPLVDLSQNTEMAGITGAKMMSLLAPDLDVVYTFQTFSSAFNGKMRALHFSRYYGQLNPGAQVINIAAERVDDLESRLEGIDRNLRYGLFVVNDNAHAACEILKRLQLSERFTVIGFDLSPFNRSGLQDGSIAAILGQRPISQAYDAIMYLYRKFVLGIDGGLSVFPVDIFIKENLPSTDCWL